jgi:hypothetical protein
VNVVNGQQALSLLTDIYPTGANPLVPRALVMSVDLQGSRSSFLTQAIVAPALDETNVAWWQTHLAELNDPSVSNLAYVSGTAARTPVNSGDTVYNNELTDGAIADWMNKSTTEAVISAQVSYTQSTTDGNGNTVNVMVKNRLVSVKLITTDAETMTYQSIGSNSPADPLPANLAQNYYDALALLQYEGSFAIVQKEVGCGGGPWGGHVLNLTGSRTEWATMLAQIHTVTEDLNEGRTTLRFGPHAYLSPQDLVAHLRATRARVIPELDERNGGIAAGGPQNLPDHHKKQTPGKLEMTPDLVVPFNGGANSVTVRPTDIASVAASLPAQNLTLTPQIISLCNPSTGAAQLMLVLGSAPWTPSG